jgi:hypothetical protein
MVDGKRGVRGQGMAGIADRFCRYFWGLPATAENGEQAEGT